MRTLEATLGLQISRQSLVRDLNVRAVYEHLSTHGPISRAELARELNLSQASVGRIIGGLLRAGLVREGQRVTVGIGRPQTLIHQNESAALVVGARIRSRSLRVHLANLAGTVLARGQTIRSNKSPKSLARQLTDTIDNLRQEARVSTPLAAVAIGVSSVWSEKERKVYAAPNLPLLDGLDAQTLFRTALTSIAPGAAVKLDNEINFAALGELAHGVAQTGENFFYLSLGSGVGGASVVNGTVQQGETGFVGELGYLPVYANGRLAPLEEFVARHRLEELVRAAGVTFTDQDVFDLLDEHTEKAAVTAEYISDVLGQALVAVVTMLNPSLIVLGGGVGRHGTQWTTRIRNRLAQHVPTVPKIVPTAIGPEASLLGAVAYARKHARHVLLGCEGPTAQPTI